MTGLWVALAGGLGSFSRYWVGNAAVSAFPKSSLPPGTLIVNVLGSLAMGILVAFFAGRTELDSQLKSALCIGFLGGFTTYSSFAMETITMLRTSRPTYAAVYVATTLVCAGLACFVGISLGKRL